MPKQSAIVRSRPTVAVLGVLVLLGTGLGAQAPPQATAPNPLPLRRVVLYKSGVAHFEHLGRVRGNQDVTISFTSGQLDDVLKSLTAIDMGGGQITGIHYNSQEQIDRRLGALRLPVGERPTRGQFLGALRGARLEVASATRRTTGRLLSVETTTRRVDGVTMNVDTVSLISDAGDVHTVALDPGVAVRILDRDLNQEVGKYLALVGSVRDADVRRLTIGTSGQGERDLLVSYVSEAPVWKSTYRLVLPADQARPALLQGWAIVDNTGSEDWGSVELSLVAGAPQAFIQTISRPVYVQRPIVSLPKSFSFAPQTHQRAVNLQSSKDGFFSMVAPRLDATAEVPLATPAPPPPPAPYPAPAAPGRNELSFAGGGFGGGGGGYAEALRQQAAQADAANLGELFEYRIKQPITITKGQSALVPILSSDIKAERVSVWNAARDATRALRAVWITNSSGLTLDGGNFSVIDADKFAGEGLVDPLKPGERRLLSFAVDLGLVVRAANTADTGGASRVSINRGVLRRTIEHRRRTRYTVRNEDAQSKTLILEHPATASWELSSMLKPIETTADWYRFRVEIAPHATAELDVQEVRPISSDVSIASLTDDQVALFVKEGTLSATLEAGLRDIQQRKADVQRLTDEAKRRTTEIEAIHRDQARVRDNMSALKGTPEERQLLQRYVRQLDDQETRIRTIEDELRRMSADLDRARAALLQAIERLG